MGRRLLRLGILGSGKGSNMEAICAAIDRGELEAEVGVVISDVADAGILEGAKERSIPVLHVDAGKKTRLAEPAEEAICERLAEATVDLVILAGFMRVIGRPLLETFEGRILNIHPSLLPNFRGLDAWGQALAAGVSESGCTVHHVTAEIDGGQILAQATVPVLEGDSVDSLRERIHKAEHVLYPQVIAVVGEEILANEA